MREEENPVQGVSAARLFRPRKSGVAFEKDLLTGTILRHLYHDQNMRTCGFEKIERPFNNYFDLSILHI